MRNPYRIVLLILGMFPLMSTLAFSVPGLISYKGQLTDASGGPITTSVDVTFTLWDAETGGTQLGSGFSDTDSVTPNADGIYDTLIGDDNNQIPGAVFENDPVWLNVNVDGEDLSPRTRLTPVGAALHAGSADTATAATTAGDADTVDGLEGADLEESADITTNANAIAAETNRAQTAEATLSSDLIAETATARAAEQANAVAIAAEENRAQAAELTNATDIAAEATTARAAETTNAAAIAAIDTSGITTNANNIAALNASAFIKGSASAYVVVETTDNAVTNGTNLIAAYAAAKALTPHGQALGADNRAVVLVPPGKYDLGTAQLEMDTEFVDVVGLSTARENQHIYGTANGAGTGVLRQTAANVKVENLFFELMPSGFGTNYDDQDPAAYFPDTALASTVVRNCLFKGDETSGWSMRRSIEYAGHYEDCTGGNLSFGYNGDATGTFTNCTGGDWSFGSFGGTASGTFTSCTGGSGSFGGSTAAGGKFYFCSGGSLSFTTTGSPTVIHCIKDGVAYP